MQWMQKLLGVRDILDGCNNCLKSHLMIISLPPAIIFPNRKDFLSPFGELKVYPKPSSNVFSHTGHALFVC